MTKTVTVVGQGYVGLPLAKEAAAAGWKVYGFDLSSAVVNALNTGQSHIDDISDHEVLQMKSEGYEATTNPSVISESSVVVICVPTPLGEAGAPDVSYIEAASRTVAENLSEGTVVILESTTYPGTTENVCAPIITGQSGFPLGTGVHIAFSPERVDPGRKDFGIKNTPKLIGGLTAESTEKAANFYQTFVDSVVPMKGAKEAETAKLLENTFRHVNIALVNEMAKVCHELDIDIWEVIRGASTKPFGFMPFKPGPGVGGHCIPIDPNYLSFEVRRNLGYPLRFVELAQEINNSMPMYVASRTAGILNKQRKSINGSTILFLGITYKKNIADQRESPAIPLAEGLLREGAHVKFYDPYVSAWNLNGKMLEREQDLETSVKKADAVLLLQAHDEFDLEKISTEALAFLDTTGTVARSGFRL